MSDAVEVTYGDLSLTTYPYSILFDGLEYGAPRTVIETLAAFMLDGDVEVSSRSGNRTLTLPVLVEGADMDELAENCEALAAEADKARNLLTIDPGDGFGAPTAFQTFRVAELPYDRSEAMEGARLRSYVITLSALPFGRSDTEVTLTPTPTSIGTSRQQQHTVSVAGSARTEAALSVQHATASLGEVLVYSCTEDGRNYSPALRQFATAATTTAATTDTATVSNKRNMLDTAFIAEIPGSRLYEGRHQIVALLRASAGGTANLRVRFETVVGSTVLATEDVGLVVPVLNVGGVTYTFGVNANSWRLVHLGDISLPTRDIGDPSAATIRVTIVDLDTSGIDVDLDDVWLCNLDVGNLTWVDCGKDAAAVGGPAKRLFLLPPSITEDRPRILTGHSADMSDAFNPGATSVRAWGRHVVRGGEDVRVTTMTTNTTGSVLGWSHVPAWFTHARQL